MEVGRSIPRVDAIEKVTGRAQYTADYMAGALVGRVLHSAIASGYVKSMDISKAERIPGVLKVVTCFDVPDRQFSTPGQPWSADPGHRSVADRKLLNRQVRFYGDDIAAVVAENEVAAGRALRAIQVEYEELPVLLTPGEAMREDAPLLHEEFPGNVLKHTDFETGDYDEAILEPGLLFFDADYQTHTAFHGHIETVSAGAYMEGDRIVIVTGTQSIYSVQRVTAQALGLPWGKVRVIKPYVGGSFGNRQDVLYEPLAGYLSMQVGGRKVLLQISQEETMSSTRCRHAMDFHLKSAVRPDGRIVARSICAWSNQGGYASQGHSIVSSATNSLRQLYTPEKAVKGEAWTVYTNRPVGGAMRGYGVIQGMYAGESHMDDMALALGLDPCDFREMNMLRQGDTDPLTGIVFRSVSLPECLRRGRAAIGWDEKRKAYKNQSGPVRRGVGMGICCYKTGGYPNLAETAAARLLLGQEGMVHLQVGSSELGQGSDTALLQIAADALGVPAKQVHISGIQDIDSTPYDNGAYASRQTYITGNAVKQTAEILKNKILTYACFLLGGNTPEKLDLRDGSIVNTETGKTLLSLAEVAIESIYNRNRREQISAESTFCCRDNPLSTAACFVEIKVDLPLGRIKVEHIINIHDSGRIIHPQLAAGQVHGGMGMGLGYATMEQAIFDEKGRLLNNNMLDYKLPTAVDLPELQLDFVETEEPSGPFGNKSLAEPPIIVPVTAVRNALLHATGIAFHDLPLSPQRLTARFREAGII